MSKIIEQHRQWTVKFDQSIWANDIASLARLKALAEKFPNHQRTQEYYQKRLSEMKKKYPNVKEWE
jgi:hypothetical protein